MCTSWRYRKHSSGDIDDDDNLFNFHKIENGQLKQMP